MAEDTRQVAIVTTTIFPLVFLEAYADNLLEFGHAGRTTIYIAGDRKSPPESEEMAAAARRRGIDARFLSIDDQARVLEPYGELAARIPEDTDNRRNAAFVAALRDGAEVIVSIDDDNFCLDGVDFVGLHGCVGMPGSEACAVGANGWYNACSMLDVVPATDRLYARGFPYRFRAEGTDRLEGTATGTVGVNAGLWLLDPDCDAIGRLQDRPQVTGWHGKPVILGEGVLAPINTQNTALTRAAMGAYYYVRMGAPIRGLVLDRFGDIFSGYFLQACVAAVGERVRIGDPIVEHRRHAHDLLRDLYHELAGIMILEDLALFFADLHLPGDGGYLGAYRSLASQLAAFCGRQEGFAWTDDTRAYFRDVADAMRIWADVVADIG